MPRFLLALVGIFVGVVFTWHMAHAATTGSDDCMLYVMLGIGWIVLCSFNLRPSDD
jgi:purine-cytosine permease-like protein